MVSESESLDAALRYAARDWHVLPMHGKVPTSAHGLKDATRDPATIRNWWGAGPASTASYRRDWKRGQAAVLA